MDVENLGEAVVAQLVEAGKARDVGELYALTEENLLDLEGFAEKSAKNLVAALESSKSRELWRLINGLGIKHVGTAAAKDRLQIAHHRPRRLVLLHGGIG